MPLPNDYWASYEQPIGSLDEYLEAVGHISAYQEVTNSKFAWRGVARASYAMHSSLVREFKKVRGVVPANEATLRAFEAPVIEEARTWGLDWHLSGGHLSSLEFLAALQHYGAPTRLIDFTFNPLIALWFAVEKHDSIPGRVFAIDIFDRMVTPKDAQERDPWWLRIGPGATTEWTTRPWIWRPPPFEARFVRQEGCFLMGGIPSTNPGRRLGDRMLTADEIRECMTVPFQLIQYRQAEAAAEGRQLRGYPPKSRAFTLVIRNKVDVRKKLVQGFGYSHGSLFPDFPGFAEYGQSWRTT